MKTAMIRRVTEVASSSGTRQARMSVSKTEFWSGLQSQSGKVQPSQSGLSWESRVGEVPESGCRA